MAFLKKTSIGKNDRAALINIGRHADVARIILRETSSRSARLIWLNEVRGRAIAMDAKRVSS